jgi:hypothetical protein
MKMKKLEWNYEEGEGAVIFTTAFMTADRLVQLD